MAIYLDHHATTPLDPLVLEAMLPYLRERFGNASSLHEAGREARAAVERGRRKVAELVGAGDEEEIIFTSGATESDNLAVKGVVHAYGLQGDHVVTVATEHKAVLEGCRALEREGRARVTLLAVRPDGLLDLEALRAAITPRTILVSVMGANNEIGVLQDIAAVGAICRERGVLFHTDAAQAAGKVALDVERMNVDLASFSAHKMYGPKGIGALYVRKRHPTLKRVQLTPAIDGGGHERGFRAGTLNVPGIVGFGEACSIAGREMAKEAGRLAALRERLWKGLAGRIGRIVLNGHPKRRLPGNLNVTFSGVEGGRLLESLGDVCVSIGAACATAAPEPSHVLKAIGVRDDLIHSTVRFGLGRFTTESEIDAAADRTVEAVRRLRAGPRLRTK